MNLIQHDGAWWDRRPDGSIAVYDENTQEWKDWSVSKHGPPPPALGVPGTPAKKKTNVVAILIVVALLFAVCSYIGANLDEVSEGDSTTYTSEVTNYRAVNPASIQIFVNTTNTGSSEGTPSCTAHASDRSGAYSGFDSFELDPIPAGENERWNGYITIENEGASFVTEVSVECE